MKNWAGNYRFNEGPLHTPATTEELQEMVRAIPRVKVLGTRHSFNGIADSPEAFLSLQAFNRIVELDKLHHTVTVEAGIDYATLNAYLHEQGYALHNLASLVSITVAGACITATHGSGNQSGNLSTAVRGLKLIKADGEILSISRSDGNTDFDGMVVNLGALGVVTELTLEVLPTFDIRQYVYRSVPFPDSAEMFNRITSAAYSVCLFTNWEAPVFNQAWLKLKEDSTLSFPFGEGPATERLHPIEGVSAENCTEQRGIPRAWSDRLPHFQAGSTPSHGDEIQSEYFIPRRHTVEALSAIYALRDRISPILYISEIRTVAKDRLWLSPCYNEDRVGIHFTWKNMEREVRDVLPLIEATLAPFQVRPHWGKIHTLSPGLITSHYPRWADFCQMANRLDPEGKFRNAYLEALMQE